MSFIFSQQRVAQLHRTRDTLAAVLLPQSVDIKKGRLRWYYREYVTHDADGNATGKARDKIDRLTIVLIERVDTEALTEAEAWEHYQPLTIDAAKACGFKTSQSLQADWKVRHPSMTFAQLAWFVLGDWRDATRYLRRNVSRGGDYVGHWADDVIDELPALTPEQLREVAANNHQRFTKLQADRERARSVETLAQRVARLEAASEYFKDEIKQEIRIIGERTRRGINKLNRPN